MASSPPTTQDGHFVYDPDRATMSPTPVGNGLRWEEVVEALATAYEARFE